MTPIVIPNPWPCQMPASRFRIMRPTAQYLPMLEFYQLGVGLPKLGEFVDHDGYNGSMLGLPGESYHLEIISTAAGDPNPCLNKDNGFVFYLESAKSLSDVVLRLEQMGYSPVEAKNPWWGSHGAITFEDPDGWPVVLSPSSSST